MRVIIISVGRAPRVADIEHTLDVMQKTVGGYIRNLELSQSIDLWFADEFDMPPNLKTGDNGAVIFGDAFIAGHNGDGETVGLTEEQARDWLWNVRRWPRAIPQPERGDV